VLESVDFTVARGEYVSVVGPSGSGKTTVLRCIAGLLPPTAGEVRVDGVPVRGTPESLAVVFQDYSRSLMPWLTVLGNVTLPLRGKGLPSAERRGRSLEALAAVGLEHTARQYPWQLSGGMQQRVSIARALAYRPALMLMDEPFASLDAQTRADLEDLLLRVRTEHSTTILLVTHDIDESVYLSDRVLVLSRAPATVLKTLDVGLPAARDQVGTRGSAEFVRLRTEVARLVHS
jgi:NitT/TauT family transport system ATP-binding protein